MSHVITAKIYDLGTTVLADISGISLTKSMTRQLNGVRSFTFSAPANSSLLTDVAGDGFPNLYDGGNRKLVVWEDGDPDTDDPIFHGRIFTVERSGDENSVLVNVTAYDPWMELGYEGDNRAGRVVRDDTATTFGDPSFLTPLFSPTPSQDGISGPDLIKQILTYSQGDPSTNPVQGEGPLPIDLVSGSWDLDVPPAIDVNPVDSADWPVLVGDFITQLIATDAVDLDFRPIRPGTGLNLDSDTDDYIMVEASSVSKMGTDRSATVHFDYLTGSFNAMAAREECDFSLHCDRLWYELGPRLDKQHWRGDITPHSAIPVSEGLLTLMDDSATKYGGPNTLKGYNASVRISDSLGTENSARPLYQALYAAEVRLRVEPRRLLYVTPCVDEKALFEPPQDYDVYDVIQIKTGADFGVELDEKQRVYGYTKTWSAEGVASVSELLTSADVSV